MFSEWLPDVPTDYLFSFFLMYSVFGWICEEIWCTIAFKKVVKRGMLHGPICPIYGFGALSIWFFLYPFRNMWIPLFFASMLVTSLLEYFTSWLLEKLFHAKWWDYSEEKFNLNGRVCLLNSFAFGIGGLAFWHLLHPFFEQFLYKEIFAPYIPLVARILSAILSVDIIVTVRKLVDFTATMEKFKAYGEQLKERFDGEEWFQNQSFRAMLESIKNRANVDKKNFSSHFLESLEKYEQKQKSVEYWFKKFPTMTSKSYSKQIEHFRSYIQQKSKKNDKTLD